jgi:hypothetical protein
MVQFEKFDPSFYEIVRDRAGACHQIVRQENPRLAVKIRIRLPPSDAVGSDIKVSEDLVAEENRIPQVKAKRAS